MLSSRTLWMRKLSLTAVSLQVCPSAWVPPEPESMTVWDGETWTRCPVLSTAESLQQVVLPWDTCAQLDVNSIPGLSLLRVSSRLPSNCHNKNCPQECGMSPGREPLACGSLLPLQEQGIRVRKPPCNPGLHRPTWRWDRSQLREARGPAGEALRSKPFRVIAFAGRAGESSGAPQA